MIAAECKAAAWREVCQSRSWEFPIGLLFDESRMGLACCSSRASCTDGWARDRFVAAAENPDRVWPVDWIDWGLSASKRFALPIGYLWHPPAPKDDDV